MRSRVLFTALLLAAACQLHCGSCGDSGGAGGPDGADGAPRVYAPPPSLDATQEAGPRPVVALSMRGASALQLGVGWPWLLSATVRHPAAFGEVGVPAFELSGPAGSAESAFRLVLQDAAGQPVAASFERLGAVLAAPVQLGADTVLELSWRLPSAEASRLAPGDYSLVLELEATAVKARSVPVALKLSAAPDAGIHAGRLAEVDDALARGDRGAAARELDAILASAPMQVQALSRRAALREEAGDPSGAFADVGAAIHAATRAAPRAPEGGPRHLYQQRARLGAQLDGGDY